MLLCLPSCYYPLHTDDYRSHTSCLTEVERYKKRAPKKKNGKVPPQQLWMDLIADAIDTAPAHLKHHLRDMATLDNVPRKEKPFRNFTSNSLNLRGKNGDATVSEIWSYLKEIREKQQQQKKEPQVSESNTTTNQPAEAQKELIPANNNASRETSAVTDEMPSPKQLDGSEIPPTAPADDKGTKSDNNAKSTERTTATTAAIIDKKVVKKAMKKALKKASDRSLTVKLLRKTVRKHLLLDQHRQASCSKSLVKDLVQENLKSDSFVVDRKRVTLMKVD